MEIEFYHTFVIPEKNLNIVGQWDLTRTVKNLDAVNVQGKTFLDVACRDGFYGYHFEKKGAIVTHLDMDDRAARRFMREKFESKAEFIHMNGYGLHGLNSCQYDVTFAGDVLCHVLDPVRFLRNIHHVTREHFYIVADIWPTFETWYDGYPFKFTQKELFKVLGFAGFLEPTVLASYKIEGGYWLKRGAQGIRDVQLIRCKANPAFRYGDDESIVPKNQSLNLLPELTYHFDFKE